MSENPLIDIEAETEDGPGTGNTEILFLIHSSIKIFPGSDIVGVPASEINDKTLYEFNKYIIFFKFFFSLNLWLEISFDLILKCASNLLEILVSSHNI